MITTQFNVIKDNYFGDGDSFLRCLCISDTQYNMLNVSLTHILIKNESIYDYVFNTHYTKPK